MSNLSSYAPLFFQGTLITICAWATATIISGIVGTLLGIMSAAHISSTSAQIIIRGYTFITKGIPAYVQILICYFVIPSLLGIQISGFVAATGALALCSSGYITEIMRGSINAIAAGQWNAATALGYSRVQILRYIILPQALHIALPALIGELEQLLKSTSLLATIGVTEITRAGMNIISRELNPLPIYAIIACIYLLLSALLQIFMLHYECKKVTIQ